MEYDNDPQDKPRRRWVFRRTPFRKKPLWAKLMRATWMAVAAFIPGMYVFESTLLPGRGLTPGEREDQKDVFGGSVDYDKVKVHSSPGMDVVLNPAGGRATGYVAAHTRWNTVVISSPYYSEDYSMENPNRRANYSPESLIYHEGTHAWQNQNCGIRAMWAGVTQGARASFNRNAVYTYKLEKGKDLLDYNLEQQASIIADFYGNMGAGLKPNDALNTESMDDMYGLYKDVLKNFEKNPGYIALNCAKL